MNLGSSLPQRCAKALLEQEQKLLTDGFQPKKFLQGEETTFLEQNIDCTKTPGKNLETREDYNTLIGATAEIFLIALVRLSMEKVLQDVSMIKIPQGKAFPLNEQYQIRKHRRHQLKIVDPRYPKDMIAEYELVVQAENSILCLDATTHHRQVDNKNEKPFLELRSNLQQSQAQYELEKMHVLFTDVPREPTFREKKPGVHVLRLALLSQVRELLTHYAPDIPKPDLPAKSSDVQ